jgi:hypothetical protein
MSEWVTKELVGFQPGRIATRHHQLGGTAGTTKWADK